jgi:hypothetical protein
VWRVQNPSPFECPGKDRRDVALVEFLNGPGSDSKELTAESLLLVSRRKRRRVPAHLHLKEH